MDYCRSVSQDKTHGVEQTQGLSGFAWDVAAMTRGGAKLLCGLLMMPAFGAGPARAQQTPGPQGPEQSVIRRQTWLIPAQDRSTLMWKKWFSRRARVRSAQGKGEEAGTRSRWACETRAYLIRRWPIHVVHNACGAWNRVTRNRSSLYAEIACAHAIPFGSVGLSPRSLIRRVRLDEALDGAR